MGDFIFDNNHRCGIPLNKDNLNLCVSLGNDEVYYTRCSEIIKWLFGVEKEKKIAVKKRVHVGNLKFPPGGMKKFKVDGKSSKN